MEETQLIIAMYQNNISVFRIASVLKKPQYKIYEILYENGFTLDDDKYFERNNFIKEKYTQGYPITSIANLLGISRHTVSNVINRFNIKKGIPISDIYIPEKIERTKKIIDLYNQGLSCRKIANEIGMCASSIQKILVKADVKLRPQHSKGHSKGTTKNRKYFFDTNYFSVIDTEEKAYWLGFLYADGYVSYKGAIVVDLKESDKEHIEKFKSSINGEKIPLKYNAKTKSYRICVSSVQMAQDLYKLGCFQNKSLRLKFPSEEQVPKELIYHFMRGYFDGDGCITYSKGYVVFHLIGTKDFLDGYEKVFLENNLIINTNKRLSGKHYNENTQSVSYASKKALKIFDFLYKNATIYLDRKYNLYINEKQASKENATELLRLS